MLLCLFNSLLGRKFRFFIFLDFFGNTSKSGKTLSGKSKMISMSFGIDIQVNETTSN